MRRNKSLGSPTTGILVLALAACHSDGSGATMPDASVDSRPVTDTSAATTPDAKSVPDGTVYPPNSRKCSLFFGDATDCTCNDGTPTASNPPVCSTDSVVTAATDRGVCCQDDFGCECQGYACASGGSPTTCACARIGDPDLPSGGTAVAQCTPASSSQKCCYSSVLKSCRCTSFSCTGSYDVELPSCTLDEVAVCGSDATSLTNCK